MGPSLCIEIAEDEPAWFFCLIVRTDFFSRCMSVLTGFGDCYCSSSLFSLGVFICPWIFLPVEQYESIESLTLFKSPSRILCGLSRGE